MEKEEILKKVVEQQMKDNPINRDNNNWLVINVLKELGYILVVDLDQVAEMPPFESITRLSRKLKEENPNLKGSEEAEERKREIEKEFKQKYSKKMEEDFPVASKYIIRR